MKSFKKTMMALAFAGVATQVQAGQFYVDMTGTSVGTGADGVCVNCTGLKDQVDFSYDSFTTITLGDGMLDVGDAIHTTGGLNTGNLLTFDDNNAGFLPSSFSKGLTDDRSSAGTSNWGLSFSIDLMGTVAATDGTSVSEVEYNSGIIEIYLVTFDGLGGIAGASNIMDLTVLGSGLDNNSNFLVNGIVSFSGNEAAALENMFHYSGTSCGGNNSFKAIAECVPAMEVQFLIDQNLDNVAADFSQIGQGIATISGDHNGSLEFNVPEPATLLLMGGALAGFGFTRRRKV